MLSRRNWVIALALAFLCHSHGRVQGADGAKQDIVNTAVNAGSFKTLAAALQAAGLVETLQGPGPFTVFAPTDEAFAALPAGTIEKLLKKENQQQLQSILTFHVVAGNVPASDVTKLSSARTVNGQQVAIKINGQQVMIDDATVVQADIECTNGVIHVIDHVLLPTADRIPDVAEKAGTFKTLLAAAKAAGLSEVLAGDDPLTVFAPTDEAFAKLPAGTVESLLKPENRDKLVSILKFHVVPGRIFAAEVLAGKELKTVQGTKLTAHASKEAVTISGSKLLTADIDAANGVIHVIDSVLLPPTTAKGAAHGVPRHRYVTHVCPTTGRVTYRVVTMGHQR